MRLGLKLVLGFFLVLTHFLYSQSLATGLWLLLAVAGVIGIRSPIMVLMVPTLLWRFAGNVPYYWGWEWHYSAILMPIAAIAFTGGPIKAMPFFANSSANEVRSDRNP